MTTKAHNEPSFFDHLEVLRKQLLKILTALFLCFPLGFFFADYCIELLLRIGCPPDFSLRYFSPLEPFIVKLKMAFFICVVVLTPYIGLQLWKFVAPGLRRHERSFLLKLALASWGLFMIGLLFCGRFIIPALMRFSLSMQNSFLLPAIGINNFVSMSALLIIGFGVMFQFPIAIFLLVQSAVVSVDTLKKKRPLVLIILLILSAVLTPPDIISQILMALPTYFLFELSLFLAGICYKKRRSPGGEESDDEWIFDEEENMVTPEPEVYRKKQKQRRIYAIGYHRRRRK